MPEPAAAMERKQAARATRAEADRKDAERLGISVPELHRRRQDETKAVASFPVAEGRSGASLKSEDWMRYADSSSR